MFEKEAKELFRNSCYYETCPACKESFEIAAEYFLQKGAEFGYNKAKEEMQEQGLALQSDMDKTIEQNIALKQQIEKMKCCGNCEHFNFNEPNYCHKGVYRERQYVCSDWEFGN